MIRLSPLVLQRDRIRLEPLASEHVNGLAAAAADGNLWELFFTSVPRPEGVEQYVQSALEQQRLGTGLPWVVRELESDTLIGTTRYHDVVAGIDRVEIGYTWYASKWQRSFVNSTCKLLLLEHAFETVGCAVVGFRTDGLNLRSQRAIESLGAKRDGVLRHHTPRVDGSVRDTVMFSILRTEWPSIKKHLETRLRRHEINSISISDE